MTIIRTQHNTTMMLSQVQLPPHQERGQAFTEFIIVLPILIGLSLLCIEMGRWYMHRQLLHYALYEAARAGSKDHANPKTVEQAFLKASRPLFVVHTKHLNPQQYQAQYFQQHPWEIKQLSPTQADFQRHGILKTPLGMAIPNTFLSERPKDIYQANTLELQLNYRYKPLIPFISRLIGKDYVMISITQKQFMQSHVLPHQQQRSVSLPTSETERSRLEKLDFLPHHTGSHPNPQYTPIPIEKSIWISPQNEKCGISLCCDEET